MRVLGSLLVVAAVAGAVDKILQYDDGEPREAAAAWKDEIAAQTAWEALLGRTGWPDPAAIESFRRRHGGTRYASALE